MTYAPVTPFRRPITAVILQQHAAAQVENPSRPVDKWEVLRELTAARETFGLSDRDLSVLQALVSFHKLTDLAGGTEAPVVHPSNRAICERLNGMPCSTMRRHLARLVEAGVILRRDSPNGKRYVRRYAGERMAFGFDLGPLVSRFAEICEAANARRAEAERLKRLRATVSLMRRDLAGLADYGRSLHPELPLWDQASDLAALTARDLRRKLDGPPLVALETILKEALDAVRDFLESDQARNMSTNGADIEQHQHNSKKDRPVLEPCLEQANGQAVHVEGPKILDPRDGSVEEPPEPPLPNLPLGLVVAACPACRAYADGPIRHWHDLVGVAHRVRPFMGISPSAWEQATDAMGPETAAVVVLAILQRFDDIRSPGGYLRALTSKACSGSFSCAPMIMALVRKDAA